METSWINDNRVLIHRFTRNRALNDFDINSSFLIIVHFFSRPFTGKPQRNQRGKTLPTRRTGTSGFFLRLTELCADLAFSATSTVLAIP